ncbi:MAG TPA: hypothetical protein VIN08_11450, partial [Ohtaekwangia sp.]|uniref:hypothetical protein n=1 Tax=Ohtaekwangia sp. TaxID=2066019 RepID=UPI002F95D15D
MITHHHDQSKATGLIKSAFEKGFHHAANAFSQFAAIQLSYSIVHEEFHVVEEDEVKNLHCFIENKSS